MYLFPVMGIPFLWYRNGFTFGYPGKSKFLFSLIAIIGIWLIFFIVYFVIGGFELRVSHEDYIIYSRLAYYNDLLGVENTFGFYSLFGNAPHNEVYHFFELWLSNVGNSFNQQGQLKNLFFFVFPLISWVSVVGLKEMLRANNWYKAISIFLLALLISSPYDLIVDLIKYPLPLSGVGNVLLYLKHVIIFPVIIYVLNSISNRQLDYYLMSLFSLFYPLIIPMLFPALIIYEWWQSGYKVTQRMIFPIAFSIFFGVFMLTHGNGDFTFNLSQLLNLRMFARILLIGCVVPIVTYCVIYFVYLRRNQKDLTVFLLILLVLSNSLWFLLQVNINANQFFSIPFHSILVILTSFSILYLIEQKRYGYAVLSVLIYVGPFAYKYLTINFIIADSNLNILVQEIPKNERVLYVPSGNQLNTVFDYNERMSLPINSVFLNREDLHIINISSAYVPAFALDNPVRKATFDYYRKISPYFNFCGEFDRKSTSCLDQFAYANDIRFLLLEDSVIKIGAKWTRLSNNLRLTLYSRVK